MADGGGQAVEGWAYFVWYRYPSVRLKPTWRLGSNRLRTAPIWPSPAPASSVATCVSASAWVLSAPATRRAASQYGASTAASAATSPGGALITTRSKSERRLESRSPARSGPQRSSGVSAASFAVRAKRLGTAVLQ